MTRLYRWLLQPIKAWVTQDVKPDGQGSMAVSSAGPTGQDPGERQASG
jgi:hypothetical protein